MAKKSKQKAPTENVETPTLGAPTSYREEYDEQVRKLCMLGATDTEIANFFEVSTVTIGNWKNKYKSFLMALKEGKSIADSRVAEKLFHRATGYSHPEDKINVVDKDIVVTPTIKHYPPDTVACIFWLKNRRPDLWRDKHNVEHTGKDGETLVAQDPQEIARRVAFALIKAQNMQDEQSSPETKH